MHECLKEHSDFGVAVVAFPWESMAPYKFLSDVLKILEPLSERVMLISGNTHRIGQTSSADVFDIGIGMHYLKDIKPKIYSALLWMVKCVLVQLKTTLVVVAKRKDFSVVVFYMAYPYYLCPLIAAKLLGKKTVEIVTRARPISWVARIISMQDSLLYRLIDGISPEVKPLVNELGLERYQIRILSEGARFVDTVKYGTRKRITDRKNIVGFIGRITKEKGIVDFVQAIRLLCRTHQDMEFLIGGSGDLLDWVQRECTEISNQYNSRINVTGWIGDEMPDYLNELKLLVYPTYGDAFPTMILEAMSCGTPVLTTSVGTIPHLIKDKETGFIMENNSYKSIAENIVRCLNYQDMDRVVANARALIQNKYTYEGAVNRWGQLLTEVF